MRPLPLLLALLLALPGLALGRQKPRPKPAPKPAPVAAPVDPAKEVVARIQKFYESTTDLHARFEQEVASGLGVRKKASGEVWLKKPGRMRWEYQKPEKKLMVADGTALWVYEPDDEQAFRQNLSSSSLPSSVTFLWGAGRLGDEFEVTIERRGDQAPGGPEALGVTGDVVLKLVPKQPTAQYRHLFFVVDGQSFVVKETVVFDQQGGKNHMRFRELRLNQGVGDDKFRFTPPPGTNVIRP